MICEGIICKTCVEMVIEIAVNPDHVHIFFKYPPKYSLSFIAKKIKGVSSRILRKEFPHLQEWCGDHLWAPSCFHGSVGNGWEVVENIFVSKMYMNIIGENKRNGIYRPWTICPGYTVT